MTNLFVRIRCTTIEILTTTIEIIFSIILTTIFAPTFLVLWIVNQFVRSIVKLILLCQTQRIHLLSDGADGIWAYRKFGNSRNILIIFIYAHQISLEKFQSNYEHLILNHATKDGCKPYEKLKRIFTNKYGYYCWKESKAFNIRNHVKNITTDSEVVTESRLKQILPKLTADMDESKPQWEELIIPNFRYDHEEESCQVNLKSARIYRSHHAFMDGCSHLIMTGSCMGDCVKFPYILDPFTPVKSPKWKILLYKLNCLLMGATAIIKNLYSISQLKSRFFMRKYSGNQLFSWSECMNMNILKETKKATRTSIPSIFASVAVTALQNIDEKMSMDSKTKFSDKTSIIGLVGAILPYNKNFYPRNRFTVVNFSMKTTSPCKTTSRIEKLKTRHQEFLNLIQKPDGLVNYKLFKMFGKFPSFVIQFVMKGGAGVPVIYSNTPWATHKVSLWGDKVHDVFGWMPLLTTAGIGLVTASYGDNFRFCVIADQSCLPQKELDFLMEEIYNELHLLHKDSKEFGQVATTMTRDKGEFLV